MSGQPPPPPPPAGGPPVHAMYSGPPPGWPPASGMQPPAQYPAPPIAATSSAAAPEKKPKKEKPKKKDPIPGAPGWLRITTNLGNVFYTHTETKRSEWTIPDEIKQAVAELEAAEKGSNQPEAAQAPSVPRPDLGQGAAVAPVDAEAATDAAEAEAANAVQAAASTSDGKRKRQEEAEEDEEVDGAPPPLVASVSEEAGIDAADLIGQSPTQEDDEDEEESDEPTSKRLRTESRDDDDEDEGDDEDMAWQLQAAAEMAAETEAADAQELASAAPSIPGAPPGPPPSAPPPGAPLTFQTPPPPPGGYTGPPPSFVPVPIPAFAASPPRAAMSLEEGRALFMRMLTSLNGTPEEVNPMAPWDRELVKFVHRSEYTALAHLRDRQDAFNDWCRDRIREKRKQRAAGGSTSTAGPSPGSSQATTSTSERQGSSKTSEAAQVYRKLLEDNVKSTRMRFDDFRKEFKKDRRFFGFGRDDKEREKHFKIYLRELGERKRKAAEAAEADFVSLLDFTAGSARRKNQSQWADMTDEQLKNGAWRSVKKIGEMETRKEYDAVGSSSRRAELFVQWARGKLAPSGGTDSADGAASSSSAAAAGGSSPPRTTEAVQEPCLDAEMAAKRRREKALQEREEQVRRQRQEAERKKRRALGEATRGDSSIRLGELLVDAVRDPLLSWTEACRELGDDARFEAPGMHPAQKREMFAEHVAKLVERKRAQLRALFEKYAPKLDTEREVVLPLVKEDAEYERLRMRSFVVGLRRQGGGAGADARADGNDDEEDEALGAEWKVWQRQRENRAKDEFQQMLKENSFVDFWGRLRSESQRKSNSDAGPVPLDQPSGSIGRAPAPAAAAGENGGEVQVHTGESEDDARTRRLLRAQQLGPRAAGAGVGVGLGKDGDDEDFAPGPGAGDDDDDDEENADLVRMSAQVDLEEIHSVLRNDARYRAWGHARELREEWIREYLRGLGGRSKTVFQQRQ